MNCIRDFFVPHLTCSPIEPMSCIIGLALLNMYPEGTKISIRNHRIIYNPPTYYQGIVRKIHNCSRYDLYKLYCPIYYVCNHQYITYIPFIRDILPFTIKGLIKLKNIYFYTQFNFFIDELVYMIYNFLNNKIVQQQPTVLPFTLYSKTKSIWTTKTLENILKLLHSRDKQTILSIIINKNYLAIKRFHSYRQLTRRY